MHLKVPRLILSPRSPTTTQHSLIVGGNFCEIYSYLTQAGGDNVSLLYLYPRLGFRTIFNKKMKIFHDMSMVMAILRAM